MLGKAADNAILGFVRRADMSAEVSAIDLGLRAIVADLAALQFFGHRLTNLMG